MVSVAAPEAPLTLETSKGKAAEERPVEEPRTASVFRKVNVKKKLGV